VSEREIVTLGHIRRELVRAVQRLVPVEDAVALALATHALKGEVSGTRDFDCAVRLERASAMVPLTREERLLRDPLGVFIDDMIVCTGNSRDRLRSSDLYAVWSAWCARHGVDPGSHKAFSMEMVKRGFRKMRTRNYAEFFGIAPAGCPGTTDGGDAG